MSTRARAPIETHVPREYTLLADGERGAVLGRASPSPGPGR